MLHQKYAIIFKCLALSVIFILVLNYISSSQNFQTVIKESPTKYILYWNTMFGNEDFNLGLGSEIFAKCEYKNCYATNNKTLIPVEKFSAIIFHGVEYLRKIDKGPSKRSPDQVYIYSNQESPLNTPDFIKQGNGFYNWTMTHRLDSDLVRAYGYVLREDTNYTLPTLADIRMKEFKIAWFVSNCPVHSRREKLAKHLQKYIPVDIYGACGNLSCPRARQEECYNLLEDKYQFYFSAENSICLDYVTEKLYNVLKRNVIPLVYGGSDYNKVAPPHSFIDVAKFDNVLDLAIYLTYVSSHPEEYLKYFEWKKKYAVDTSSQTMLCDFCEKLNKPIESKVYEDIYNWWFGENRSMCKSGNHLPKIVHS